ncbi:DNA glycosylase [Trametes sanguinea]|nr:DNA glycosylase [Trametes sanguinea]
MKRTASSLVSRPSPYHASVTLFEPGGGDSAASTPRRSKRLKVESEMTETSESSTTLQEDGIIQSRPVKTNKRNKTVKAVGAVQEVEATEKTKTVKSPRKAKPIPMALETPHPEPPHWREAYDAIKRMRSRIVAPVDTMGCDQAQLKETDPKNQRFSTLVSLMLSSQTKDEVTDAAVAKLREAVGGSLSVDAILQADESAISEAICKVGFWRRKTQYIRQAAQKLRDEFGGDIPKTVDELCSLPGVGPKMAFLALQVAWKLNAGIGVDVHVHRITNRLGWHKPPTKTPEETRLNLQSWLPLELHPEINHLLVGFGQTICTPVAPKCDQCELSDGLCPSARTIIKGSSSKRSGKVTSTRGSTAGPKIKVELEEDRKHEVQSTTLSSDAYELTKIEQEVKVEDIS